MPLLDLNAQTTTRLGLEPIKNPAGGYFYEGCIPTRVVDFHVTQQEHTKGEFSGLKVPVLQIEFENFKLNQNDPDRFYTHSLKVVGTKQLLQSTTDQYENRKAEEIDADTQTLWKAIKHFLENLTASPNYRNVINVPKADQIKYFDLPGIAAPTDRIKGYENFFEYLVAFVNGDGKDFKSQIVDAEGKTLPMWVKMLPNYDKDPKKNAKYYAISRFINQGVFEPMKVDKGLPSVGPKIIRVKPTESLVLTANTGIPSGQPSGGANALGGLSPEVANLLK
jgi:hypothetical protein